MNSLKGVIILDYSSRLPGPLASSILQDLGASVTKVEIKEDPFSLVKDDIFFDWYESINKNKTIAKESTLEDVDIVIVPNEKLKNKVVKELNYKVLIQIGSNSQNMPMHDLNALAESESFKKIGNQSFPFIPIMGIELANKIALTATSALYRYSIDSIRSEHTVYLDQVAKLTIDKLAPNTKSDTFLHMGKYPCYQLYDLKGGHKVAMANVEEHLWLKFCETFKITLHTDDRFDTTDRTLNKLKELFATYSKQQIEKIINENKLCLTVI